MLKEQLIKTLKERITTELAFSSKEEKDEYINQFAEDLCAPIKEKYYGVVDTYLRLLPITISDIEFTSMMIWDLKEQKAYFSIAYEDRDYAFLNQLAHCINNIPMKVLPTLDYKERSTSVCCPFSFKQILENEAKSNKTALDFLYKTYFTHDFNDIADGVFCDIFLYVITGDETAKIIKETFPTTFDYTSSVLQDIFDTIYTWSIQDDKRDEEAFEYMIDHQPTFCFMD